MRLRLAELISRARVAAEEGFQPKMSGKEKFYTVGRSATAGQKRNQQLELWEKSITNREPSEISTRRIRPRVKFGESVIFLAASQSGDVEEVERLLSEEGADINSVNKDGLTALHQCCIDDDYEIVQLLVRHGAKLDIHDNEGWTPLHAAASCGHEHIVSHLLDNGAFPAPVNNEGDTPVELAEDDVIRDLITEAIHKQGVDVSDAKTKEESLMLADANRLKNDPSLAPASSRGGATALHVAAAKNYLQVLEVLLSQQTMVNDIDSRDEDGWTALHAAVYWENMEAAAMLVKNGAGVHVVTKAGDTIDDLCRPEYVDELDELKELCESTSRNRCYAMNHKRPSLLHQNSRDEITGGKPSPTGVRRRSSRDRSMFPKIDMASEKAIIESWTPEEVADGNRGIGSGGDIDVFEETQSKRNMEQDEEEEEEYHETENNVKETVNSLKEREMVAEESNHVAMSSSKPPLPPGTSPLTTPRPQAKVEPSQTNGKLISPHASPKTTIDKRRPMSGQMMKRVTLWEQQSSTNLNPPPPAAASPSGSASSSPQHTPLPTPDISRPPQGAGGETKRFPFVSKTVTTSKAEDRLKPARTTSKRNSYDETKLAHPLPSEETTPSRTSSLPRNARMSLLEAAQTPPTANDGDAEVAVMTTEAMPTQSVPIEGNLSRGGEGAKVDVSRELSRGESVESLRSDRSFTEESETNRRRKAKKSRETRKKTQPVPSDLFEKLAKLDSTAEKESGKSGGGDVARPEVERETMEIVERLRTGSHDPVPTSVSKQSAFRPSVRPSPLTQSSPPTELPGSEDKPPSDKDVELGEYREGEEEDSCKRSRTKSAVRRKPREQRKPTGIVQFDNADLKNASEEVASLFRKPAANPETRSVTVSGPETTPDVVSNLRQEVKELKKTYGQANEEMAGLKLKVSELSRRLEDVTRAYQQERREKEEREQQITRLQSEARSRDELKVENQRLKDENSALIRVIGKLSRAPIRPA